MLGIGIYESGRYLSRIDYKITKEYDLWQHMLSRCQPDGFQQNLRPTYIGCSVHDDFIKFQDFAKWCQTQIGFGNDGWALDKDILIQGNKVYGPDTCCFVPRQLNTLFTHKHRNQGDYPTGVSYFIHRRKYQAKIRIDGKQIHLGLFDTPDAAEMAYIKAKINEICRQAEIWKDQIDPRVYTALLNYEV